MKLKFLAPLLIGLFLIPFSVFAVDIPEGATVKTADNPDVYIIKYNNGKQFKRLVLNPQVFESYGHLSWDKILTIDQATLDKYTVSDFVTVYGTKDVYQLVPDGDNGSKYLTTSGYDPDSVYVINEIDFRNYILQEIAKINDTITGLQNTIDQQQEQINQLLNPTPAPFVAAVVTPTPTPTPILQPLTQILTIGQSGKPNNLISGYGVSHGCNGFPENCTPINTEFAPMELERLGFSFQDIAGTLTLSNFKDHAYKAGESVLLKQVSFTINGVDIDNDLNNLSLLFYPDNHDENKVFTRNGNTFLWNGNLSSKDGFGISVKAGLNESALGKNLSITFNSISLIGATTNLSLDTSMFPLVGRTWVLVKY